MKTRINEINKVDSEFVIKLIEKIQKDYERLSGPKNYSYNPNKILLKIYRKFVPEFLKNNLFRPIIWELEFKHNKQKYYFPGIEDKKWGMDFLLYVLKNPNVNFDLSLFNDEDKYEIIKFIRNKVYVTFAERIPKDGLFDKNNLETEKKYEEFLRNNVKVLKDKVISKCNKNKFVLPKFHIGMPIFFHRIGIDYIPKEIRYRLKNTDFIDTSAFIGDSALVLNELKPNHIFAFEPEDENFKIIKSNN